MCQSPSCVDPSTLESRERRLESGPRRARACTSFQGEKMIEELDESIADSTVARKWGVVHVVLMRKG